MRWTKFFPDGKGGFEAFDWGLEYDAFQIAIKVVQTLIIFCLFPFFVIPVLAIFIPSEAKRIDRVVVPIVGIFMCLYMLIDLNEGWLFCYLYRDTFTNFYIYTHIIFAYAIIWFIIFLAIEFSVRKKVDESFDTFEASPYSGFDLLVIWGLMFGVFIFWFEPTFHNSIAEMVPQNFSPWFENVKLKYLN